MSTVMLSAEAMIRAFASGEASPEAVLDSALAAMDDASDLNAFWTVDRDGAQTAARAAGEAWRAGRPTGALCGVPVAVKDIIDTAGIRTTCGSAMFRDHVPTADAAVVTALQRAGAVIVGKSATHEFAYGVTTVNEHFGPTHNPHDRERIVGGSSGGSAAAVGGGLVPLALGSDTTCSVRLPPAFTGCVGFRPTHDSVSSAGVGALAPSLDVVGPIGVTVGDTALLAEVLWQFSAGPAGSPVATRISLDVPARIGLRPVRVGVIADRWPIAPVAAVLEGLQRANAALAAMGCDVGDITVAGYVNTYELTLAVMGPEAVETHRALGLWPHRSAEYGTAIADRLRSAEQVTIADHIEAMHRVRALRHALAATFRGDGGAVTRRSTNGPIDVILTPVAAITAPLISEADAPLIGGRAIPIRDLVLPFNLPAAFCGLPSIVLPVPGVVGMPTSVMLTAAAGDDRTLLDIATLLESTLQR
jgi:aspartyl-tRNA(Asn)/glutamyl-tRNA(Gln) amidotransferase subunit A